MSVYYHHAELLRAGAACAIERNAAMLIEVLQRLVDKAPSRAALRRLIVIALAVITLVAGPVHAAGHFDMLPADMSWQADTNAGNGDTGAPEKATLVDHCIGCTVFALPMTAQVISFQPRFSALIWPGSTALRSSAPRTETRPPIA